MGVSRNARSDRNTRSGGVVQVPMIGDTHNGLRFAVKTLSG